MPVTIRWDGVQTGTVQKTAFPISPTDTAAASLNALINSCQPATFGLGGQDVYDENYRKAIKLDEESFSTNFDPHSAGMIDVIGQVLLPAVNDRARGVQAELYKLNIYSAPSGMFHAHVDTPRSESQFGSLVVCLPCPHQDGALVVRHKGDEMKFDWAVSSPGQVQWAAFYGDCEHEVLEVTSGHRVTLTYNLYATRGNGLLAGECNILDPKQLPLYTALKQLVELPGYMENGRQLGIGCEHFYAHAQGPMVHQLPESLKGSDMAVYEIFRALGLATVVRPILDMQIDDDDEYYQRDDYSDNKDDDSDDDDNDVADERETVQGKDIVGTNLHSFKADYNEEWDQGGQKGTVDAWGEHIFRKITWINRLMESKKDTAMAYLAYGNQAEMGLNYSRAAIIAFKP
ncbi:hypothetical protein EJ08DRAFT_599213 [Tothia fuscella]|uniref:Fe2OG dioxygenase domain-containing protein n=1 Tax=Tothia fuscella TaxID=1048955 RepID=A0A9P4TT99_9PEZI|nr:hypothetical protein EJ08DRAFT_599213 [Tothia fuscella]